MELIQRCHVPYPPDAPPNPLQTFDVYVPAHLLNAPHNHPNSSVLVCFIHGGAWRTEDKADHVVLGRSLAASTGCPVALPNYRLTPTQPSPHNALHHPAHASDVLRFLEYVLSWHMENGGFLPRKPSRLFLIGHSCATHMLSSIFLRMPCDSDTVCPSDELVRSTVAIIMSEGIYDIDLLLSSFPQYRTWFIENAFGRKDTFENVSAFKAAVSPGCQHIHWLIIHSKGDTLVDMCQSEGMHDALTKKSCLVSKSFDELQDGHDDILKSPKYVDVIDGHIKRVSERMNA